MYDTLHFWQILDDGGGKYQDTDKYLSNARHSINNESGIHSICGNIDNFKVVLSSNGVSIKGSLAKYYFGDNFQTLTRPQVKDALIKFSDRLHIDLMQLNVTRLDVSTNFIMSQPINVYFDVLGQYPRMERLALSNNTLTYQNAGKKISKSMVFYDKIIESKVHKIKIPIIYTEANVLRYECRWIGRLANQFKEPEVKGCTLFEKRFYDKVISLWAERYFQIEKQRTICIEAMDSIKTVSNAEAYIYAIGLQRLSPDELQRYLNNLKPNLSNRRDYSRLKQKLKETSNKVGITESNDLIIELDSKVKEVLEGKR
jgi:hypothetical protein